MSIELVGLNYRNARAASFTRWFEFSDNDERNYVVQVAKKANNEQVKIFLLKEADVYYGFIALSVNVLGEKPCIDLKYIFVSAPFRGRAFPELGNLKLGQYFIGYAVQVAKMFSEYVPLRYIALQPASDALESYYKRQGFIPLDPPTWMFLKI